MRSASKAVDKACSSDGLTEEKPWLASRLRKQKATRVVSIPQTSSMTSPTMTNNQGRTEGIISKPKELDLTEKGQIVVAGGYISADGTKHEFPKRMVFS